MTLFLYRWEKPNINESNSETFRKKGKQLKAQTNRPTCPTFYWYDRICRWQHEGWFRTDLDWRNTGCRLPWCKFYPSLCARTQILSCCNPQSTSRSTVPRNSGTPPKMKHCDVQDLIICAIYLQFILDWNHTSSFKG